MKCSRPNQPDPTPAWCGTCSVTFQKDATTFHTLHALPKSQRGKGGSDGKSAREIIVSKTSAAFLLLDHKSKARGLGYASTYANHAT